MVVGRSVEVVAIRGFTVKVFCSEIDVFILLLFYRWRIPASLFIRGIHKTFAIQKIADKLGSEICQVLLGLHAFTGCDTVIKFTGHGKKDLVESFFCSWGRCYGCPDANWR